MIETEYLRIYEYQPAKPRKTKCWDVHTKDTGEMIGAIGWNGKQRRYTFYPDVLQSLNGDVLKDIGVFINLKTKEHKSGLHV